MPPVIQAVYDSFAPKVLLWENTKFLETGENEERKTIFWLIWTIQRKWFCYHFFLWQFFAAQINFIAELNHSHKNLVWQIVVTTSIDSKRVKMWPNQQDNIRRMDKGRCKRRLWISKMFGSPNLNCLFVCSLSRSFSPHLQEVHLAKLPLSSPISGIHSHHQARLYPISDSSSSFYSYQSSIASWLVFGLASLFDGKWKPKQCEYSVKKIWLCVLYWQGCICVLSVV